MEISFVAAAIVVACAAAQAGERSSEFVPRAGNLIIPQSRSFAVMDARVRPPENAAPRISGVTVGVLIVDQVATTTMDVAIQNPSPRQQEAEMLVPVPDGAALGGFTFAGSGSEPTAELLPKEEARRIYQSIVSKLRDPALVEFAGYNLIRTSVFPVPANGTQKVRLTYEHLLPSDGNRVDYYMPRSESLALNVPWDITVSIKSKRGVSATYSPSHEIESTQNGPMEAQVKLAPGASTEPGPFILSYLTDSTDKVTATLMAYPDARIGGGYFLLLAAVPPAEERRPGPPEVKREVIVVIDCSGSMAGEKLEQARTAALQVVEGLYEGEAFNIIDYSSSVSSFAPAPVIKTKQSAQDVRHYLRKLMASGGTNIHDALVEALRQTPTKDMLPIVLFLTDGLPTVGVRDEVVIREAAAKANTFNRRIFTFGVGYDVNAPLLGFLAQKSRAVSTFVMPDENVEEKVSQVYGRLSGPVLATPVLETLDANGAVTTRRINDLQPMALPDMFTGEKLVLLGRYEGEQPLNFRLNGSYKGKPRTFEFSFKLDSASVRNNFVPRLWASRKVAFLIDEIRQAGAASGSGLGQPATMDPKMKELVDEIIKLSTEFGILTEYTAFLAREGTNLAERAAILKTAGDNLQKRAMGARSGKDSVNQMLNGNAQIEQTAANRRNYYLDGQMNRMQVSTVQQVSDRAFFQRGNRWVDSQTIEAKTAEKVDKTIEFGSPEYMKLLDRMVEENRQSALAMPGEILMKVDDTNVLIK